MGKIDYKKEWKYLYGATSKNIQFVEVPTLNYLMVHGKGEPGGKDFTEAVQALYPIAYTIKFSLKQNTEFDYVVPPLEGLWWAEDMEDFVNNHRSQWQWTMMIMQPEFVTQDFFTQALQHVKTKKNPSAIEKVEFQPYSEGKCAQILHLGPFSNEGPTVEKLHTAIANEGFTLTGKHHEIYLSDMRRVSPEKYRTIIRQPIHL